MRRSLSASSAAAAVERRGGEDPGDATPWAERTTRASSTAISSRRTSSSCTTRRKKIAKVLDFRRRQGVVDRARRRVHAHAHGLDPRHAVLHEPGAGSGKQDRRPPLGSVGARRDRFRVPDRHAPVLQRRPGRSRALDLRARHPGPERGRAGAHRLRRLVRARGLARRRGSLPDCARNDRARSEIALGLERDRSSDPDILVSSVSMPRPAASSPSSTRTPNSRIPTVVATVPPIEESGPSSSVQAQSVRHSGADGNAPTMIADLPDVDAPSAPRGDDPLPTVPKSPLARSSGSRSERSGSGSWQAS